MTTADYTFTNDSSESQLSIAEACSVGAIPFVSDICLTRLPSAPFECN